MDWRRRQDSLSSGYSSVTTCSGGLYRNLTGVGSVSSPVRGRDWDLPYFKRGREFDERSFEQLPIRQKKSVGFLPCYVKPRRSIFETADEVEFRSDDVCRKEVWIRLLGFPSEGLKDALAKYELVPLESFDRARPILVVTDGEQRKRGLLVSNERNSVVYLEVDSGVVERADVQQVFEPDITLLSIPNAAMRCRLERPDSESAASKVIRSDWRRTRVRIIKWGAVPTVSLSILDPDFDLKPVIMRPLTVAQKAQKLYHTLPGILIPPAHTILRNCSVLFHEDCMAYIIRNDAPFEINPAEIVTDCRTVPAVREAEQLYLVGDVVYAQYNELQMRVVIELIERSSIILRSIDSGELYEVEDFSGLKSLTRREPPRALRVKLPAEYNKIPDHHLVVFLKTGVFDVFFEDDRDPPGVRLFTVQGMEMNVCVSEKLDPAIMANESDDETSSARSARG